MSAKSENADDTLNNAKMKKGLNLEIFIALISMGYSVRQSRLLLKDNVFEAPSYKKRISVLPSNR